MKTALFHITLILLIASALRLAQVGDLPPGPHYDEAADTIIAREIAEGRSAPIFVEAYTGKEVLFFYWAAAWMKLIGATPFAMRLAAAMMGVLTVAATYWAIRELLASTRSQGPPEKARLLTTKTQRHEGFQGLASRLRAFVVDFLIGHQGQQPASHRPRASTIIAVLAAAFIATSFWHVLMSRLGFRSIAEPCVQALAVAALWRGLRLNQRFWLIVGGGLVGLNLYTYLAARLFPIAVALLFIYLIIADAGSRRKRLIQFGWVVLAATVVFAPLGLYFLQNPDAFLTRIAQVAPRDGQSAELWSNIGRALGMFFVKGDPYVRFNLPGRPLFPSPLGLLFVIGVIASMIGLFPCPERSRRSGRQLLRRAAYFFALASTLTMLMPTALAVNEITPSNLRGIGMMPMVFVFPALGLWVIVRKVSRVLRTMRDEGRFARMKGRWAAVIRHPSLVTVSLALVMLLTAAEAGQVYFGEYVRLPQLYYESDGDLAEIATLLNQRDTRQTPVYIHALHYRHPTLAALARDFHDIRSITGPNVLVFPPGPSRHVFAHLALPDRAWRERFLPASTRVIAAVGPDGGTSFEIAEVDSPPSIEPRARLKVNFGNTVELAGYDLEARPRSGGSVDVTLIWRVRSPPDRGDYAAFVELRDAWGFQWGQADSFDYPSEQWSPGELIVQRLQVPIAPGAPRGDYQLDVGWYSAGANRRLPIVSARGDFGGTMATLSPIAIARATREPIKETLGMGTRIGCKPIDGLCLLGASLETPAVPQGAPLFFTLFWRADTQLPDLPISIRLSAITGLEIGDSASGDASYMLTTAAPVHDTYPFDEWRPGEVVADRYGLRVPVDTAPGEYALEVRVRPGDWIAFGSLRVEATQRRFDVPPIAHPLDAAFGDQIALLGYDLDRSSLRPGQAIDLTLYWRALKPPDADYTVFTHLLDASGVQRGGQDNPPLNGTHNTSLWVAGEVIVDTYTIPLDGDAPSGEYAVEIGLYRFDSGARLPLSIGGDAMRLATIRVMP